MFIYALWNDAEQFTTFSFFVSFGFCKPSFPYLYIIHFYSVFVPHRTNNNISMFLQIHEFQTYLTNIENIGEDDDEEEREKYH